MAAVVADRRPGPGDARAAGASDSGWLGVQLEVSRRLRTDPAFRTAWAAHALDTVRAAAASGSSAAATPASSATTCRSRFSPRSSRWSSTGSSRTSPPGMPLERPASRARPRRRRRPRPARPRLRHPHRHRRRFPHPRQPRRLLMTAQQLRRPRHPRGRPAGRTRSSGSTSVEGAARLPFRLKVLLENLLRTEDGANITADHIRALGRLGPGAEPDTEIQFTPARVLMQDFTGVPCVVDLAAMREAMAALGGDPSKINPLAPAELVIDHCVIADVFGGRECLRAQRRAGVRAQPGALPVPALGPERVRRLPRRAAGHRHRAPGQPRVPRPRRLHATVDGVCRPTPTRSSAPTRTPR